MSVETAKENSLDHQKAQGSTSRKVLRVFCWMLLALHASWICVHAYYHSKDYLNPWKLGGYAMYTRPAPAFEAELYPLDRNGDILGDMLGKQMATLNDNVRGGCLSGVDRRFYASFIRLWRDDIHDYPHGARFKFIEYAPLTERPLLDVIQMGHADIYALGGDRYRVEEVFCGKVKVFEFERPPE